MKLTALDLRKQEFNRTFRGFDTEEVEAFLQMVSTQWQEAMDELRRLEEKVREQEFKLEHYQKVEEALEEALKTARETSRRTLENAEQRARHLVEEAEQKAGLIMGEAEQQARKTLEDARQRSVEALKQGEAERHQLQRDVQRITSRRNEIVARLRAFLMSEMELLAHFEGDEPIGFIKLLPAQQEHSTATAFDDGSPPSAKDETGTSEEEHVPADTQEPGNARQGWTVRSVVTPAPGGEAEPESAAAVPREEGQEAPVAASADELEKIRRILEDLG
jgi:DivIVA domain-containing protein